MRKIILFVVTLVFAFNAMAQLNYQKIYGTSTLTNNGFGSQIDIDGDVAIAQANHSSTEKSVSIFRKVQGSWELEETLIGGLQFGSGSSYSLRADGIAVDDNSVFVGEWGYSSGQLYIYNYDGTTWYLAQTISKSESFFGQYVTADNDLMVVSGQNVFYQYKYNGSEWVEENTIVKTSNNVIINNQTIAVSCNDSEYAPNHSAVAIYNYNAGVLDSVQKVNVATLDTNAAFGTSIAIEGDMMVIGASYDYNYTYNVNNAGRAFLYRLVDGLWEYSTSFETNWTPEEYDRFGSSTVIYDGDIYIGEASSGSNVGTLHKYVFDGTDWVHSYMNPAEIGSGDYYADRMSFSNGTLMVGAHFDDDMGTNRGAIYMFDICANYGPDQEHEICLGDSVLIDGVYYHTAQTLVETATNAHGCDSIVNHTITVLDLPVVTAFTSDDEICEGETITLSATGASLYTWDNGAENELAFQPTETTTFTVTGSDGLCNNTDTITVTVHALPEVNANASATVLCEGDELTLYGSGDADDYIWDNSVINDIAFVPTETLTYTVTGTNANCENTAEIEVFVNPLPEQPIIIPYGTQLMSSATEGNQWYFYGVQLSGEINQMVMPQSNGDYTVEVTMDGCTSMSEVYNYTSVNINTLSNADVKVFPTFTSKVIYVEAVDAQVSEMRIQLISITGNILSDELIESNTAGINVENYQNGIYFLKVEINNKAKSYQWVKQ